MKQSACKSSVFVLLLRLELNHGMQLFGRVAQQCLQVTHETVHVALPGRLVDNVFVVVVAQAPTKLLVVHLGLVLAHAPAPSHFIGIGQLELPAIARPTDEALA